MACKLLSPLGLDVLVRRVPRDDDARRRADAVQPGRGHLAGLPARAHRRRPAERHGRTPWNKKLSSPGWLRNPLQAWVEDDNFDIDYHVRRSALPAPGDERELGIVVSRLHSNQVDFTRPPWEVHFIEGLEGGRFAMYVKVHHSLVDGVTGMKLMTRSLSTDPEDEGTLPFFAAARARRDRQPAESRSFSLGGAVGGTVKATASGVGAAVDLTKALTTTQLLRSGSRPLVAALEAPQSVLNSRISRNRRLATQQYSLSRLKKLGAASGSTLNDIVLAICGGGLRRFLLELGELPAKPLVGFVPVSVRPNDSETVGGNATGAILATMGTDLADPTERLEAIKASTTQAKKRIEGLRQEAIIAYSGALLAPAGLQLLGALTGVRGPLPRTFNVCASNVPGPSHPLYFRGARLEAAYPLSITGHSMALNITMFSYADTLNIGFIGCRDTLPHLQRLALYTGDALDELEAALA